MSSKYILSCHCQTHVYILSLPIGELERGAEVCDCSWCLKRRLVWGFYSPDSLVLHRGAGKNGAPEIAEYWFGAKKSAHKVLQVRRSSSQCLLIDQFCGSCGTFLIMEHNRPDDDKWFVNVSVMTSHLYYAHDLLSASRYSECRLRFVEVTADRVWFPLETRPEHDTDRSGTTAQG